jgi:hypothetical protein
MDDLVWIVFIVGVVAVLIIGALRGDEKEKEAKTQARIEQYRIPEENEEEARKWVRECVRTTSKKETAEKIDMREIVSSCRDAAKELFGELVDDGSP